MGKTIATEKKAWLDLIIADSIKSYIDNFTGEREETK